MDNKILLSELAERLAVQSEISKRAAESFLRTFFSLIEQNMLSDRFVKIKDIGTFKLVDVNDRESVNVATGERIQIESHSKISFVAEGKLRDLVNRPFAYLTNIELEEETTLEELNKVDQSLNIEEEPGDTPEETIAEPVEDITPSPAPIAAVTPPVTESIEPFIQPLATPEETLPAQITEPAVATETVATHEAQPMPLATMSVPPTVKPSPATGATSSAPHDQAQEIALALLKIIETAQGTHLTPQELVSAFQMLQTPATESPVATPVPEEVPAEKVAEAPHSAATGRLERRRARRGGKRISAMGKQQAENATAPAAPIAAMPIEKKEEAAFGPTEVAEAPTIVAEEDTPRPVRLKDRQNSRRRARGEVRHTATASNKAEEAAKENLTSEGTTATTAPPATHSVQPADESPAAPTIEALTTTQPATPSSTSFSEDAVASLQEIMQSPSDLMTALQEVTQSPQEVMEVLRELAHGSAQEAQPQRPQHTEHPQPAAEVEFTPFVRPARHAKEEEEEEEESEKPEWKRFLKVGLIVLAALLLIAFVFWLLSPHHSKQGVTEAPPAMEQAVKSNAAENAYVDSICETELKAMGNQGAYDDGTTPDINDTPENIEQLPNAAYEILGTAEVHTMQTGETLNYLALKTLGTADLVNYIIFYNDAATLANITAGTKVKVPTLRRKSTGEIINRK